MACALILRIQDGFLLSREVSLCEDSLRDKKRISLPLRHAEPRPNIDVGLNSLLELALWALSVPFLAAVYHYGGKADDGPPT
jgi:hypothetical protein